MKIPSPREPDDSGIACPAPVALGCWPISGMTSLDVNDRHSLATLHAALESGVNHWDTAFCYGRDGESERLIGRALQGRRDQAFIATKGGLHWDDAGNRQQDARPERLREECEISLRRLQTDRIDLLYLHAPDPNVPLSDSVGALDELRLEGKTRRIGVSNVTLPQLQQLHGTVRIDAIQPPYNMLQRQIEQDLVPWCATQGIWVCVYWPLLKGLLAGRLDRGFTFRPGDGRAKYPMFQGQEWERNQDFLDELRDIALSLERTVAQLVINWTIHRPGITAALCGAKRPEQIRETAGAMGWRLTAEQTARIDAALERRGTPAAGRAI